MAISSHCCFLNPTFVNVIHSSSSYINQLQFLKHSTLPSDRCCIRRSDGLSKNLRTPNYKCFSQKIKAEAQQPDSEYEFERLFSNLNQSTFKREPGFCFLFLWVIFYWFTGYIVNEWNYLHFLIFINVYRKFIKCNIPGCRHYGMIWMSFPTIFCSLFYFLPKYNCKKIKIKC